MRKYILFITIAIPLLLIACAFPLTPAVEETETAEDIIPTDFKTPFAVMTWVEFYVTYTRDIAQFGCSEYWQTPEEVLENKKGDCEDYVILWMYICNLRLGIQPSMEIYYYDLPDGSKSWHAVGRYLDEIYDGTGYHYEMERYSHLFISYDYQDAMDEAAYVRSVK